MSLLQTVPSHLRSTSQTPPLYMDVQRDSFMDDLLTKVSNQQVLTAFMRYCIRETSTENLLALLAVRAYEKHPSREKLAFIQHHFIAVGAVCETNIMAKTRKMLKTALPASLLPPRHVHATGRQRRNALHPAPPHRNLFQDTGYAKELLSNLADTWSRFTSSDDLLQPYTANALGSAAVAQVRQFVTSMQLAGFPIPTAVTRACCP